MFVSEGIRAQVAKLLSDGLRPSEIARELELAGPTVDYHVSRLRCAERRIRPVEQKLDTNDIQARRYVSTRSQVFELLKTGLSRAEIARRLGIGKGTVSYHARRLGEPVDARCARRYDWSVIQRYYDAGHSLSECIERFGFARHSWHDAVKRDAIVPRPKSMPIEALLAGARNRSHLKKRLLAAGLKAGTCEECGIGEWRGRPLSLALHHVNGKRHDNRLENIELLCPNCHSQTDTYAGRNPRRGANKDTSPADSVLSPSAKKAA
ncbi:MAG: hypothetical protein E6G56_06505 [Actinobacteria bacterium]|nr:MAG: hypothetical protein E6G56_06505 [Actinomycetota bacterium]